jgi:hypothetical protein
MANGVETEWLRARHGRCRRSAEAGGAQHASDEVLDE